MYQQTDSMATGESSAVAIETWTEPSFRATWLRRNPDADEVLLLIENAPFEACLGVEAVINRRHFHIRMLLGPPDDIALSFL